MEVLTAVPQTGAPEVTVAVLPQARALPTSPLTAPSTGCGPQEVLQGQNWGQLAPGVEWAEGGGEGVVAVSHQHWQGQREGELAVN